MGNFTDFERVLVALGLPQVLDHPPELRLSNLLPLIDPSVERRRRAPLRYPEPEDPTPQVVIRIRVRTGLFWLGLFRSGLDGESEAYRSAGGEGFSSEEAEAPEQQRRDRHFGRPKFGRGSGVSASIAGLSGFVQPGSV